MAVALANDSIGAPPFAPPARPRVLLIGTALACAAIVMAFAGLLGLYAEERAAVVRDGAKWIPKGVVIDLTPFNVAFVGLIISIVVLHWAVYAISNDDRPRAYLALGLAALLGAAYINSVAFSYTQMGFTVNDPTGVGILVYAITGMHLAMAGAGVVFIALMAFRTLGGQYSGRDREGVVAALLYWYVTVAVYAVIWFTIFVTK
ncbi:MAG: cytochrome c oxidase subunit [Acidimicrobiaceae bacterium]|jgi:heme/copper-type cytochrome/quinol oxidase subunit 3